MSVPPQIGGDKRLELVGLLPILWSHGTGSEVMQRIAVPMIGGMVSFHTPHPDRHPRHLRAR